MRVRVLQFLPKERHKQQLKCKFLLDHLLSFYLPFFLMCLVSFIFAGIAQLGRAAGLYSVAPDKLHVVGSITTAVTINITESARVGGLGGSVKRLRSS